MNETLSRQMQDYFAYLDEAQGTTDLEAIREPRIGAGPVRPIQLAAQPTKRTGNGWLAAGAAAAAVLVLLGGWALLFATPGTDAPVADSVAPTTPDEPPTVRQSLWPGLTDDIPDGVESGTLTSPSSSARWVHLSGDEYTLPSQGPLEVNADGEFIVSDLPTGFWYSDGGIEWRWENSSNWDHGVPADTDQMTRFIADNGGDRHILPWVPYADGSYARYWTISTDPLAVWSWEGGPGAVDVDLSEVVLPDSEEFVWDTETSADYDGVTWDTEISRPVTRYRNPGGDPPGTQSILHLTFLGPGLGDAQREQTAERFLVLDWEPGSRTVTTTAVPWDVTGVQPSDVALFGTSDSVYAYVRDWISSQTLVWRTEDGYNWTKLNPLGTQLGISTDEMLQITVLDALQNPATGKSIRNQMVVATISDQAWESTDGVNWTPAPQQRPSGTTPTRLESGWFATDGDGWWMHLGGSWVSLAELGLELDGQTCGVAPRAAGQTTVFFATEMCNPPYGTEGPTTDLWIISLNP